MTWPEAIVVCVGMTVVCITILIIVAMKMQKGENRKDPR